MSDLLFLLFKLTMKDSWGICGIQIFLILHEEKKYFTSQSGIWRNKILIKGFFLSNPKRFW